MEPAEQRSTPHRSGSFPRDESHFRLLRERVLSAGTRREESILATALSPRVGYDVSAIAREALQTGRSVAEVARERTSFTEQDLLEILDPAKLTRNEVPPYLDRDTGTSACESLFQLPIRLGHLHARHRDRVAIQIARQLHFVAKVILHGIGIGDF